MYIKYCFVAKMSRVEVRAGKTVISGKPKYQLILIYTLKTL